MITFDYKKGKVLNIEKDRYYVYALCKPCGTPFYIGKGSNDRINTHFWPSKLKQNTTKTGIIKKYGEHCQRHILCYFDKESDAYEYEDWLIKQYGVSWDGGLLSNYARTRFDYPTKTQSGRKGNNLGRLFVYTDEQIISAYRLRFTDSLSNSEISEITGINIGYLHYVLIGKKCVKHFEDYVLSGKIENNLSSERSVLYPSKIPDSAVFDIFKKYFEDNLHIRDIVRLTGISENYIRGLVRGNKRKHLLVEYSKINSNISRTITRSSKIAHLYGKIDWLYEHGYPVSIIGRYLDISTHRAAIRKRIKSLVECTNFKTNSNTSKLPTYLQIKDNKVKFSDDSIIFTTFLWDIRRVTLK